jgi:hypothetical protein
MDSLTLTFVILIFLACLGLYFATVVVPPEPVVVNSIKAVKPPLTGNLTHPLFTVNPAVLRQNVAVARFL